MTQDFNAAVVQRPLFGLFGWPRNYLILGLPLLEILSPDEALAVVAHEYGHLAGSHGHFAAFIYRLRNTWGTIQAISHQWKGMGGGLLGRLVRWYAPHFNAYTFVLARANEYEADAASAELVGAPVAASALKRVDVGAAHHGQFMQRTYDQVRDAAEPPADLLVRWAMLARHAEPADARQWLDRALAHEGQVDDTHPSLRERLRALRDDAADQVPVPLAGPSAAQVWLGRQTAVLRQQLQSQWRERVIEPWKNQHADLQKRLRRLGELRAVDEPSREQWFERLCLQLELEADADHDGDLAAFNAAHADHAGGLYVEGARRLSKGDATGLDLLGRAMSLDASTTKPACEKAYAFLKERGDVRAEEYAQRWRQRNDWEVSVAEQRGRLNPKHELREPDLSPEDVAAVQALVKANRTGIKRAYLARRVLPMAPDVPTYVVALELTPSFLRLTTSAKIVHRVADGGAWPAHVIVCAIEGQYKPLGKRLKALAKARIL